MKVSKKTLVGAGIVTIITASKVGKLFPDDYVTLGECLVHAKKMEPDYDGTILVIDEQALSGKVYRYGNHGDFWELAGHMKGWA